MSQEASPDRYSDVELVLQSVASRWKDKRQQPDKDYYRLGFILLTGLNAPSETGGSLNERWLEYAAEQYKIATNEQLPYLDMSPGDWDDLCHEAVTSFLPNIDCSVQNAGLRIAQSLLDADGSCIKFCMKDIQAMAYAGALLVNE